jgi:hypothetical protein
MLLGLGAVVMLLWNAILPDLVRANRINYWQAVGLLALCRILFGNFGGRGPGPRHRGFGPDAGMRDRMRDKWMQMTPEERTRFRADWQDRCHKRGYRPPAGERGPENTDQ